jgi:shikimate dehydrogenase
LRTLTGVLGFPVGHSRSPAMMTAAFGELGLDWRYLRLPVPPELFAPTVPALRGSGFVGANVTIPHKVAAHDLADQRSPAASAIGAANSLTFRAGRVHADNTDARGFLDALGERPEGRTALVLGAGGAARAVVWALREAGASEVSIWNRTPERASELAQAFGARQVERPESAEIMVNATSVGLGESVSEADVLAALSLDGVDPPEVLVDLVYGSDPTALISWGARSGARVVDGLEVLVRQGALSLHGWAGQQPSLEVMRDAAREAF